MAVTDVLSITLWGNNLVQYGLYIGVLLAAIAGTKLVYFIFSKIFHALTKKTESNLDDIIVEALERPVIFAVFILGLHLGRQLLTLSEQAGVVYDTILQILIILNIAWLVARIVDSLVANYVKPLTKQKTKFRMDETIYPVAKGVVNFLIYAVALIVILQNLGVKITGLVAGLGLGGLAFALAAQDILGNMFGGAAVITDKPFEVGDRIKVEGQDGFVRKISLRTTTLETFGKTNIIIPNRTIADSVVENISREDMRREKVILGVEYATPTKKLEKAKKLLADIVLKNDKTDDNSLVHFAGFGPSSLDLQLIYWIKDLDQILSTRDEINFAIKKAFEKEKIEFAFPSQTIYLKK